MSYVGVDWSNPFSWPGPSGFLYRHNEAYNSLVGGMFGYNQYRNTRASASAQMNYDAYLKAGNERALRDWHRNVPGKEIAYPEFSYPGQIYRADTAIARAGFDYSNASSNYYGNLPYRTAGLYGLAGRMSRYL